MGGNRYGRSGGYRGARRYRASGAGYLLRRVVVGVVVALVLFFVRQALNAGHYGAGLYGGRSGAGYVRPVQL